MSSPPGCNAAAFRHTRGSTAPPHMPVRRSRRTEPALWLDGVAHLSLYAQHRVANTKRLHRRGSRNAVAFRPQRSTASPRACPPATGGGRDKPRRVAAVERLEATIAPHGDVALCPKDARSSFITFLRSGDHNDEVVKAAAVAMRHSSKMQASAAYDRGGSDRRVSAAMKVAADYSAKFSSNATASTASSSTDKP